MVDKVSVRLQVFFEKPFWVGIFERVQEGNFTVCKVTFGAEPKDYEVEEFVLKNYYKLKFSPAIDSEKEVRVKINPKRQQRELKKQINNLCIGTKSQQVLKLQQEQGKLERKICYREKQEERKRIQFELKQQKRKNKHKGR